MPFFDVATTKVLLRPDFVELRGTAVTWNGHRKGRKHALQIFYVDYTKVEEFYYKTSR